MILSNLAQNLRGPWMIHPEQAAAMLPVLRGVLSGYITEIEKSPEAHMVDCSEYMIGKSAKGTNLDIDLSGKKVYVTYLTGTMMKHESCGDPGTREIGNGLREADRDDNVIGHIIIADSGGGNADSVPELAEVLKEQTKPVVTWVDGMAGSACYYGISYTDKIIVHQPTDRVGCIGVLIELSGMASYHKDPKDGEIFARIYADQSFDKNAGYEAALEGDAKVIKADLLNPLAQRFMDDVKANRPTVQDEQLHGKTFFAKDVVGSLIDSIGSFGDAVQAVIDLAIERGIYNEEQSQNASFMEQYPNLSTLPSLAEQVIAEDGSTTLQAFQLEEINGALQSQGEALTTATEQATALAGDKASLEEKLQKANQRISELESSLEAAQKKLDGEDPVHIQVDKDPSAVGSEEFKTAQTTEEAIAACKEFLNK